MSGINLEKSIETLKKCITGIDEDGKYTLDRKKVDSLSFDFAFFRVNLALKNGEITEEFFLDILKAELAKNKKEKE